MTAACHEGDMLLLCARSSLNPPEAERLRALAAGVIDWELLFLLARKHRMLPLLERHLETACPGKAPRPWSDRLRHHAEIGRSGIPRMASTWIGGWSGRGSGWNRKDGRAAA